MLMRRSLPSFLCLATVTLVGCGQSGPPRATLYPTTGKVTYLNSPLVGGVVTFAPQKEDQPVAVGRTNEAGEFTLRSYGDADGAAAGEYKVLIMLPDSQPAAAEADAAHSTDPNWKPPEMHAASAAPKTGGSLLPAKYGDIQQTPLTATVEPGGQNNFPFELK